MISSEDLFNQDYWDSHYKANTTGWDLGNVSPPIKTYIDTLENKNKSILIPGCGNSYEAEYLLNQGFTNVTVIDIAPTLIENLSIKFENNPNITILLGDFFEHEGKYDLIIEQTFFCALSPTMRQQYVLKMHQLLSKEGKLAGLLFNKNFEVGPPFGGSQAEYELLFANQFYFNKIELCQNSMVKRADSELFIEFQKINK
jgi:SAM-dependent methyltransferase